MPVTVPEALQWMVQRVKSSDSHPRLVSLHQKFQFDENDVEAFEFNSGEINVDSVQDFERFLDQKVASAAAKKSKSAAAGASARVAAEGARNRNLLSKLAGGLSSALGRVQAAATGGSGTAPSGAADGDVQGQPTPTKRCLEASGQAATPRQEADGGGAGSISAPEEPPRKKIDLTLKSTLNSQVLTKSTLPVGDTTVEVVGDPKLWTGPKRGAYTWMDETLEDKAGERDKQLAEAEEGLVAAIRARHPEIEDLVVGTVGVPAQSEVVLCGRIWCEGLEGRLNERAMLLEGTRASSRGMRVQLNVSGCPQVAAFPGQLVAVLGRSGTMGTTFHARDFVPGLAVPPTAPNAAPGLNHLMHMMVLAGPFCLRDGLDFTPLLNSLEHAAQASPQLLLVMGPFVDNANKMVSSGEVNIPGQEGPATFEDVYSQHVLPALRKGLQDVRRMSPATKIMVMPSLEDVLDFHPMPQPPLDVTLSALLGQSAVEPFVRLGVEFLPNPAHLHVNGLDITVSSADALSPVLRSGLVLRPEDKKLEQAMRLLLQQRCLFPVFPRDPPRVCESRSSQLGFPEGRVPDVVIFPSSFGTASGSFVDGRLFVNPGSVCRAAAAGTFAELFVAPPPPGGANASLPERARVDVKSIVANK